ncbi:type VI secretion protein [Pseudomonas synxantha]|uniref:type VI secretion system-associated FHA domain protein TagH n=1 Tax=Pseudomonas synxantha TaxID=47883 RepID=UPI00078E980A|nr:type VI secretion system-associated FHA domain protein TagH [Pseudomonas synxantha]AMS22355.1 type VI secretion protein [Pseudomonas synxantha]
MQLVFEVCEVERAKNIPLARKVFDGTGGVIGRGSGCDWVIPDPSRVLSSHHGLVGYRGGRYFLTDISRNGTGMAGSAERLRKGQARLISDGDVFDLGPVTIRAQLLKAPRHGSEQRVITGGPIPDDAFLSLDPLHALDHDHPRRTRSEDLEALSEIVDEPCTWVDSQGAEREHLVVPCPVDPAVAPGAVDPIAVAAPSDELFWGQFATALGIDLNTLERSGREALAIKVARLFHLGVNGLQQTLRTCDELNSEFASAPGASLDLAQNPLKVCPDTGAALAAMLGSQVLGQLSAERAIVQAHRDLQVRQAALLAACRSTLRNARTAFEPSYLLGCFESQGRPPRFFADAWHWRAYQRYYQRLAADEQLNRRPLEGDFAKAYEEQVRLIGALHMDFPG